MGRRKDFRSEIENTGIIYGASINLYNFLRLRGIPKKVAVQRASKIDKTFKRVAKENYDSGKKVYKRPGDGNCFLTTACTSAEGLPDDCYELQTLRRFRDTRLLQTEAGRSLVKRYYQIAPGIVTGVNALPNSSAIWTGLFHRDIKTAVDLVSRGSYEEAVNHYKSMVERMACLVGN